MGLHDGILNMPSLSAQVSVTLIMSVINVLRDSTYNRFLKLKLHTGGIHMYRTGDCNCKSLKKRNGQLH